jgi:DNA helicase-2/ATP-dependent DNA helicase PcrA
MTVYPERLLDETEIAELLRAATRGPQAPGAVTPRANRRGARPNAATARRRPGWETSNAPRPATPTLFDSD